MKRIFSYTSALLLLPFFAHAQSLQLFFTNLLTFINRAIIPFIVGIAFLFFIINVIRYFVIGAGNEDSREKARSLAIYGVFAFVFIIVFWGVVNLFASSIGLDGKNAPTPDYVQLNGESFNTNNNNRVPNPNTGNQPGNTGGNNPNNNQPGAIPLECGEGVAFDSNGNPCGIY